MNTRPHTVPLALILAAGATAVGGEPRFTMVDLGTLGGGWADAYALNNAGEVVGASETADRETRAYRWSNGEMLNLVQHEQATLIAAYDINDAGDVVGSIVERFSGADDVGFLIRQGQFIELPPAALRPDSGAGAINRDAIVVGSAWDSDVFFIAVKWSPTGVPLALDLPGRQSWAAGINDQGLIVGGVDGRGALWRPNGSVIGVIPIDFVLPQDINNANQVTGESSDQAFRWAPGGELELGPGGAGRAINEAGIVVGETDEFVGFYWSGDDVHDLTELVVDRGDLIIRRANDINEANQIAAIGRADGGANHGLLLTPFQFDLAPPAPGTAGEVNVIEVSGLTPGVNVRFMYGFDAGAQNIPGCAGATHLIRESRLAGTATADANGVARLERLVPDAARGRTVRIHAIVVDSCEVSNLITHTFN